MTLTSRGQWRRECLGTQYCLETSAGQCCSNGAGESRGSSPGGLKCRVWCPSHLSLLVAAGQAQAYGISPCLEWARPCCCREGAHLCTAGLGCHTKRGRDDVLPYWKGRRGWTEHSLRHGPHQKNRGRHQDCLGPAGSVLFRVPRWSVPDMMNRGKSHLHPSPQEFFPIMNREWFLGGGLWARNAITYTTSHLG